MSRLETSEINRISLISKVSNFPFYHSTQNSEILSNHFRYMESPYLLMFIGLWPGHKVSIIELHSFDRYEIFLLII